MEKAQALRRVLHLQKHGTRPHLPLSVPKYPTEDPDYRIITIRTAALPTTTSSSATKVWGRLVRVASFLPFHTTYWLNGHPSSRGNSSVDGFAFHKNDNAFLAWTMGRPTGRGRPSEPRGSRKRLDYWTLIVGPKFSKKERGQISLRYYSMTRSSTAGTSSSNAISPFTKSSSAVARSASGD